MSSCALSILSETTKFYKVQKYYSINPSELLCFHIVFCIIVQKKITDLIQKIYTVIRLACCY
jgi:hypothetical protein